MLLDETGTGGRPRKSLAFAREAQVIKGMNGTGREVIMK